MLYNDEANSNTDLTDLGDPHIWWQMFFVQIMEAGLIKIVWSFFYHRYV